jgi:hypothetical protein
MWIKYRFGIINSNNIIAFEIVGKKIKAHIGGDELAMEVAVCESPEAAQQLLNSIYTELQCGARVMDLGDFIAERKA